MGVNRWMDVFYFSAINWDFLWQRPQAISEALSKKGCRVFYIEPPSSPGARNNHVDGQVKEIQKNLFVATPPGLIFPHYLRSVTFISKRYDQRTFLKWFDKFRDQYSIEKSMNIISAPFWWDEILPVSYYMNNSSCFIFDCYDDYPNLSLKKKRVFRPRSRILARKERSIVKHANLCLATSQALKQKLVGINQNVKVAMVPNGVDFDYYKSILADHTIGEPVDIKNIHGLKFGFVGALGDWIDYDLILHAAKKFPEYQFILIGPIIGVDVTQLQEYPNIHFLGEKSSEDVPRYIKSIDICLVPFRKIQRLDTINSNKLYQYLAMGKPIIGVNMVEARLLKPFIETYNTVEEFYQLLAKVPNLPPSREERIEFAQVNSWEKRAETILKESLVEEELNI